MSLSSCFSWSFSCSFLFFLDIILKENSAVRAAIVKDITAAYGALTK
jgi:hypothetical protein